MKSQKSPHPTSPNFDWFWINAEYPIQNLSSNPVMFCYVLWLFQLSVEWNFCGHYHWSRGMRDFAATEIPIGWRKMDSVCGVSICNEMGYKIPHDSGWKSLLKVSFDNTQQTHLSCLFTLSALCLHLLAVCLLISYLFTFPAVCLHIQLFVYICILLT